MSSAPHEGRGCSLYVDEDVRAFTLGRRGTSKYHNSPECEQPSERERLQFVYSKLVLVNVCSLLFFSWEKEELSLGIVKLPCFALSQ